MPFFEGITFANPAYLWLLVLLPVLLGWYIWQYRARFPSQKISSLDGLQYIKPSWREILRPIIPGTRVLTAGFLIIALARPQSVLEKEEVTTEGIDITVAMDVSSSMLAKDFSPNRIEAAKNVAMDFIESRQHDRIGLVVFSGESFTKCPITTDYGILKRQLKETKSGELEDGTAIGMGLATAVDRLKKSPAKSKVVILLTDGVNNSGLIDPLTATDIAKKFDITVYTIGVGSKGTAPYPVQTPYGKSFRQKEVKIDDELLTKMADQTGGQYFRATNNEKLQEIYKEINQLEKTKIEVSSFKRYSEKFLPFAIIASIILGIELLLRYTLLRMIP